jgi:hypothetical protein
MTNKIETEFTVLSPTAILGYGFPEESFFKGLEAEPDLIAVDGGSTDPGPYYLGSGKSFTDRVGVKRDLRYMITEGVRRNIPVVVGTAGGSGAESHLTWCREIVKEITVENQLHFKLGLIYADFSKSHIKDALNAGKITPLDYAPELTVSRIEQTDNPVAQMGVEPFMDALEAGCQVILAGRAYDPACFAALPILKGYDPGLALHMGKILECAAIASTPGSGSDCVLGILTKDSFRLETLSPERRFTPESTAAHTLYEKSDPYHLAGPGGALNLENCTFTDNGTGVTVKGSRFEPTEQYTLKLEGSRCIGYRTISIAGTRDSILIGQIEKVVNQVKERVDMLLAREGLEGEVTFHLYGKNGVMGSLEPKNRPEGHEMAILIDVMAPEQTMADTICSMTRSTFLHYGYEGRISTAGNLAFPFSPSDIKTGKVYEFSLYHIMEIGPQEKAREINAALFPLEVVEL